MSLTVSGSLFAAAWAAFLVGPALVGRRRWAVRNPTLALRAWALLFVTAALGALLGLGLALRSAAEVSHEIGSGQQLTTCQTCHAAAVYGVSWLMTAAVATSVSFAVYSWAGTALRCRRARRAAREATAHAPAELVDGVRLSVLASDTYAAAGTTGRHSRIVVTTALHALLSEDELRSVVAHEAAHLTTGHRLLLGLARLQGRCLPGLGCSAEAERSIALLAELAADDHAARRCGPSVTATALAKVAEASNDEAMRLRARRTSVAAGV